MKSYSRFISILLMCLFLLFLITGTSAQDVATIPCADCEFENNLGNKFCVSCGESLSDEFSQWERSQQKINQHRKRFISGRVDPPRLFSVPTARVLRSMDIRVMGGGAFGVATDRSFLGTIGIGLGDIAEVEFSTEGMLSNISRGSTVFPTSAFKLKLIPENKWHIPSLAIAFRSSANWQDVQSDWEVLNSNRDMLAANITNIGYDTRYTTIIAVSTLQLWVLSLHAGASMTDIRVKDLSVKSYDDSFSDPVEEQKNLIGGFFGFDIESNPKTKLMFELRTVSNYEYNIKTKNIDVSDAYLAIGGLRFFFNRWLSTDVGVWYQSTFQGIADMQIKMSLNVFIPAGGIGKKF